MDIKKIKQELKGRVAKGLNFGIEALEDVLDHSSNAYNDFILLKSKYSDLMHVSSINTLPYTQIEVGFDRLRSNVLRMIDQITAEDIAKEEMEPDLKVTALPTRRTNFFKLLDIHFQNLESISYRETIDGFGEEPTENIWSGREAIYEWHKFNRYQFIRKIAEEDRPKIEAVSVFFADFFEKRDSGMFEVYFKNIKHLFNYVNESQIEKKFFLDTLKSVFSRYEVVFLFYFAISGKDEEMRGIIQSSGIFDDSIQDILIHPNHFELL